MNNEGIKDKLNFARKPYEVKKHYPSSNHRALINISNIKELNKLSQGVDEEDEKKEVKL